MAHVLGTLSRQSQSATLIAPVWKRIAGDVVSAAAAPSGWQGTTLIFRCENRGWANELSSQRSAWLARLKAALPAGLIDDVRFEAP